jgi:hypothetical protein
MTDLSFLVIKQAIKIKQMDYNSGTIFDKLQTEFASGTMQYKDTEYAITEVIKLLSPFFIDEKQRR